MRYYFYCHSCGKEDKDFKFDRFRDRNKVLWTNVRDGYGRHITHIACPDCGDVLSGFMMIRPGEGEGDDARFIEYLRSVLTMYQHDDTKRCGMLKDAEALRAEIKADMKRRIELQQQRLD